MLVASAEAPILAMLLPSSSAPINRSRMASRLDTIGASRLPCFASRSMLARDAPISAVSLAAKNAETTRQAMTIESASQSMTSLHLVWSTIFRKTASALRYRDSSGPDHALVFSRQLALKKTVNQRRLDVIGNYGAADRLQQNEGELAALDLLVLRHQGHQ